LMMVQVCPSRRYFSVKGVKRLEVQHKGNQQLEILKEF
jgi:hypothetical protein